jgi:deoxyribodipyrimidine photo-lyase
LIHPERIQKLNNLSTNKKSNFILYWMQSSNRTEYNHALEYAIEKSNELQKPLVVFFGLTDTFLEANERHYSFLLEGLQEIEQSLVKRGFKFIVQKQSPEKGVLEIAKDASVVITDRGYLEIEKKWRRFLAGRLDCSFIQIESNVVVPVEDASNKEEYGAYTIRPKINWKLEKYLVPLKQRKSKIKSLDYDFESLDLQNAKKLLKELNIDHNVQKVPVFSGGLTQAKQLLNDFIENKLELYETMRNNPVLDYQSNMSPYLHFGQISPLNIALEISKINNQMKESYLEQLIVRRELAINFVFYNKGYANYETLNLPSWAADTLEVHTKDKREYLYTIQEFEEAKTHDPNWNAAQLEMVITGKMHNYMRMYWGKKILEWTETPKQAHEIAIYLNNKYELDGRDPNGFTGIAWCFGKHDRPWKERPIFGKVRYMNANGLRRKFDTDAYIEKINQIKQK